MSVHPTLKLPVLFGTKNVNQPLPESDRYYMSYKELDSIFSKYNSLYKDKERQEYVGYILFDPEESNWKDREYTEQNSTYYVFSNSKAYDNSMSGSSVYACCCDGTDYNLKISDFWRDWKKEQVYMHKEDYAEIKMLINRKQKQG